MALNSDKAGLFFLAAGLASVFQLTSMVFGFTVQMMPTAVCAMGVPVAMSWIGGIGGLCKSVTCFLTTIIDVLMTVVCGIIAHVIGNILLVFLNICGFIYHFYDQILSLGRVLRGILELIK